MNIGKWSKEDRQKAIDLRNNGWSSARIGLEIGRTKEAVDYQLWTMRKRGVKISEAKPSVCLNPSNAWSDSDIKTLVEMRNGGSKFLEIGRVLGRSGASCCNMYNKQVSEPQRVALPKNTPETLARQVKPFVPTYDTRSLTGKICGDPPLSRSALGQKLAERHAQVEGRAA